MTGTPQDPHEAAEKLGVDLDNPTPGKAKGRAETNGQVKTDNIVETPKKKSSSAGAQPESFEMKDYPAVLKAFGKVTGDRSADLYRLVAAVYDTDELKLEHAVWIVGLRSDLVDKLDELGLRDDVGIVWGKKEDKQQDEVEIIGEIDGAQLLDEIRTFLKRFVAYPSEWSLNAHTLWVAHAHLMDCWESTPRIAFLSPEPGSGKTRALEVTEPLVPRPIHAINTTPAYLFRKVSDPAGAPTLLYDEIDTLFGPKAKDNEEIRGLINAGHRNGAVAGRCVVRGKVIETEELPAYCAVAVAGLNDLPDTIMSRSILVRMQRRSSKEKVEPWRHRINTPQGQELGERLAASADSVRAHTKNYWPEMPAEVEDRDADVAEALIAVADVAGGHWPSTSRCSVVALVADSKAAPPTVGVQLLRDIRTIFSKANMSSVSSVNLLTELRGIEESPWTMFGRNGSTLTTRTLAQRLSRYSIKPHNIRDNDGKVLKGYKKDDFIDVWERYLPSDEDDDSKQIEENNGLNDYTTDD